MNLDGWTYLYLNANEVNVFLALTLVTPTRDRSEWNKIPQYRSCIVISVIAICE
jgi:hypothetical protein